MGGEGVGVVVEVKGSRGHLNMAATGDGGCHRMIDLLTCSSTVLGLCSDRNNGSCWARARKNIPVSLWKSDSPRSGKRYRCDIIGALTACCTTLTKP